MRTNSPQPPAVASASAVGADARIERRCIDLMYSQARTAYRANGFCVFVMLVTFWGNAERLWLLAWAAVGALLMAIRAVQSARFATLRDKPLDLAYWRRRLEEALLANGCFWGVGCAWFTLIASPYQLPVIVLIVGGLQTGSVLTTSYLLRVFALFSLPLMLLPLAAFIVLGATQDASLFATAALLAVWCTFIMMAARGFGAQYRRSIARSLKNLDLAQSLTERNDENEKLNRTLGARIAELSHTQKQLVQEKERADGLVAQLRTLSATDGLTGLGNRRSFDEHLASEWRRAERSLESLSLLLIDVDHFKAYNDHYGHQRGDRTLVEVARVLTRTTRREGDWAARYGGEEFAVILANTDFESAKARAEFVREAVAALAIEHGASPTATVVTLSVGVASIVPTKALEPETLIKVADAALYDAKRQGRNRIAARLPDPALCAQ
ncbi:MAG: GGDEF domain-containing protein [Pseudomonadota bacterium]